MTYDLDFQSPATASYGHCSDAYKKIQVKGQLAQKLELKQSDGHDRLQYPAH